MSLLLPDSGLIFWMALIFAIVFFLLAKFGFPVITGMVEKRNGYIGDSLRLAKEADEKIGNLLKEQARIIEESRTEQNRIMKETAAARDKMINDARVQAKAEAGRLLEEAGYR